MRYELSLTGGTFAPAVEDFDRKLLLLLDMMRSRGLDEGDVTLKSRSRWCRRTRWTRTA